MGYMKMGFSWPLQCNPLSTTVLLANFVIDNYNIQEVTNCSSSNISTHSFRGIPSFYSNNAPDQEHKLLKMRGWQGGFRNFKRGSIWQLLISEQSVTLLVGSGGGRAELLTQGGTPP